MNLSNFLFSFRTTLILLAILAIGAGCATFIENDFGTSSARVLVYNNLWYEVILVLTTVNLIGIIFKYKMWKNRARFIFHAAFVIILIGAGITRYVGYEGIMEIPEGQTQNKMFTLEPYLQVIIKDGDNTYYQEYQKEFTSLFPEINKFSHKIKFDDKFIDINYKDYKFVKKNSGKMGLTTLEVVYNGEIQEVKLPGMRGQNPVPRDLQFGNLTVTLAYGSKIVDLPFSLEIEKLKLLSKAWRIIVVNDGSQLSNYKFMRAYESVVLLEQNDDINIIRNMNMIYNKFSNKNSEMLSNISIKTIGGAPRYEHATVRQIIEALTKMEFFEEILQ